MALVCTCARELRGDALALVCARLPDAEDLLHASRVCREWRAVVGGDACEPAWAALCAAHGYLLAPGRGPAREQFRARCAAAPVARAALARRHRAARGPARMPPRAPGTRPALSQPPAHPCCPRAAAAGPHPTTNSHEQVLRDRRLKRRVELLTARSSVATLQRELTALRRQRGAAQAAARRARADAAAAAATGRAAAVAAHGGWQLAAVQAHNERLAQPQPVQVGCGLPLRRSAARVRSGAAGGSCAALHGGRAAVVRQPRQPSPAPPRRAPQPEWQLRNLEQSIKVRAACAACGRPPPVVCTRLAAARPPGPAGARGRPRPRGPADAAPSPARDRARLRRTARARGRPRAPTAPPPPPSCRPQDSDVHIQVLSRSIRAKEAALAAAQRRLAALTGS
jgi:hypothetical protein